MPGMGFGLGFGFHRRASGSSASASEQLLTLATDDSWTGLWQPPNPDTQTFRNDGANDFWSELGNGVAASPDFTQSTAVNQPQVGTFNDAMLYTGTEWMTLGTGTVGTTGLFAEAAQEFTVFIVFRAPASTEGTLMARASGNAGTRTFQAFLSSFEYDTGKEARITFNLRGEQNFDAFDIDPRDNNWHVVMVSWDGANAVARLDKGAEKALTVGTAGEETAQNIVIGARTNGSAFFLDSGALGTQVINDFAMTTEKQDEAFDLLMESWGVS